MKEEIKQLKTTTCETSYLYKGRELLLWIITGGQPCLAFYDWSFSERFPITDKRWEVSHEVWKENNRYPHQVGQDPVQGPTYDVLPKGIKSVKEWFDKSLPLKELREKRYNLLPIHGIIYSKRIHDKEDHTYVRFEIRLDTRYPSPVSAVSKVYCGACKDKMFMAPQAFKDYADFINPIFYGDKPSTNYEDLTEKEFETLCKLLVKIVEG